MFANIFLFFQESLVSKTTETLALQNILDPYIPLHKNGFLKRTFSHLLQAYEFKKYPYPQVAQYVIQDERLKHAVEKMTLQQFQDSEKSDDEFYQELLKSNQRRANKLLNDMKSSMTDDFLLR